MSILKEALQVSNENEEEIVVDAEAGVKLAQAEHSLEAAISEYAGYDAGVASLESLVATAEVLVAGDVSQEADALFATSTGVIAAGLGIEQAVLGTEISTTSIEGAKEVIAKIKQIIISAFKAAGDFFKKFMMSLSNFFAANVKTRDALVAKLGEIEKDAMIKDGALDGVAGKAGVVAYATNYDELVAIKTDATRVETVIKSLDGVADKIVDGSEAIYAGIADAMVTYKNIPSEVDSKELAMYEKEGTVTFIGQKASKFVAVLTKEKGAKIIEVSVDTKASVPAVAKLAKAATASGLADDIMKWGDKKEIAKASDGIMAAVDGLKKTAEKDLEGTQEQLTALSPLYRFVISIGFAEAKTLLDRYTSAISLGNALVAGVEKKEKEEK